MGTDWGRGWAADFFLKPPTLKASNFAALKSTDSIFTALKDLNRFQKNEKNQEASYNFKLYFAHSSFEEKKICPREISYVF